MPNNTPKTITVYIYSDGETSYDAPDDITVNIEYRQADDDEICVCGGSIGKADGVWVHRESADVHGDDHFAEPRQ